MDEKLEIENSNLNGSKRDPAHPDMFRRLLVYIVSIAFSVYIIAQLAGALCHVNINQMRLKGSLAEF